MPWLRGAGAFRLPFLIGVVLAWTLLTFLPVVRNDFVNWDDFRMFLDNAEHRGPWEERLRGAWASHRLGEYMPITWMSYGLDRSLWGDASSGYHLTSLLLHAMTALAVMTLARHFLRHALGPREGLQGSGDAEGYLRRAAELSGSPWPPAEPWDTMQPGSRVARPGKEPVAGGFRPYRHRARRPGRPPGRTVPARGRV